MENSQIELQLPKAASCWRFGENAGISGFSMPLFQLVA